MSRESIVQRLRAAFDLLHRRETSANGGPPAPRPRNVAPPPDRHQPELVREGFVEEAIPWMDAVHRFALRLTHGDRDQAADLVQDTFLKAYRSWDSFRQGTSCRSWLFTICKNTHLKFVDSARTRREVAEADLDQVTAAMGVADARAHARQYRLNESPFEQALDGDIVAAIDALPVEYRDVLVLSDLGDLNYAEIAAVLDIPLGTVKSRLYRARRTLQHALTDHAVHANRVKGGGSGGKR